MKTFFLLLFLFAAEFVSAQVVINEVYGAGGNAGALFTHDYIELFNNSATTVDLGGWSVQYASATSTSTWQVTLLAGVIEPGRTFLIQEGGGVNGSPLPLADVTGTLSMAATAGKVALVQSATPLSGACPTGVTIIDKVGYGGSANCFEGAGPSPAPSATLSAQRQTDGFDTNNNATDLRSAAPTPTNSLPRSQVITFQAIGSQTYGDAAFVLVASASSGLPVVVTSSDPSIASVVGVTVTILGAGDVALTASQAGNGTFAPATAVKPLHVAKATLSVTAVSASRLAGQPNPSFQMQSSGFVGTDTESVLDSPPVASCTADLASLPGDYLIAITGGFDNNYQFNFTPGTLTVLASGMASPSFVLTPPNSASSVFVNPLIQCAAVNGATSYIVQLSIDPAFSSLIEAQGDRVIRITGLNYGTTYFARVRTNQSGVFGKVTRFTTGSPEQFALLQSPAPHSTGVGLSPTLKFAEVPGATLYTFELSLSPSFTSLVTGQSGPRSQGVFGLTTGANYYVRVKTDLSPLWGPMRAFHTAPLAELCYVRYPAERFSKVSWLPDFELNEVGAAAYVVQWCETSDFISAVEFGPAGARFTVTDPLKFRTRYYTRVRPADAPGNWGPVHSFTTSHPADFSALRAPADKSVSIDTLVHLVLLPVPGATAYEVSLSTQADFTLDELRNNTSGRSLWIALRPLTTYYARTRTNLSEEWGRVTRFTTGGGGKSAASSREATIGGLAMEEEVSVTKEPWSTFVNAFPNPFVSSITLCSDQLAFVSVSDLQGRVIFKGQVSAHECCEFGSGWSPGIYLATLVTESERRTIRLLKK